MENFDFLDFFNTLLFFSQNHSFFYPEYQKTFFSGLIRIVRNSMFWKKPWNNPSGKFRFFLNFFKTFLFRSKKHSFPPRIYIKKIFSGWISPNHAHGVKFNFFNAVGKFSFFGLVWKVTFVWSKKHSFWLGLLKKNDY